MMNDLFELFRDIEEQNRLAEISEKLAKIGFKGFKRVQFKAGLEFASREKISDEHLAQLDTRFKALHDEFCDKLEVIAKEVLGESYVGVEDIQPLLDELQQKEFETSTADESPFCDDPECENCVARRAAVENKGKLN